MRKISFHISKQVELVTIINANIENELLVRVEKNLLKMKKERQQYHYQKTLKPMK